MKRKTTENWRECVELCHLLYILSGSGVGPILHRTRFGARNVLRYQVRPAVQIRIIGSKLLGLGDQWSCQNKTKQNMTDVEVPGPGWIYCSVFFLKLGAYYYFQGAKESIHILLVFLYYNYIIILMDHIPHHMALGNTINDICGCWACPHPPANNTIQCARASDMKQSMEWMMQHENGSCYTSIITTND